MPDYKTKIVSFRVTEREFQVLAAAAKLTGMRVSDYARELVLHDSLGWKKNLYDPKVPLTTFSGTADFMRLSTDTDQLLSSGAVVPGETNE